MGRTICKSHLNFTTYLAPFHTFEDAKLCTSNLSLVFGSCKLNNSYGLYLVIEIKLFSCLVETKFITSELHIKLLKMNSTLLIYRFTIYLNEKDYFKSTFLGHIWNIRVCNFVKLFAPMCMSCLVGDCQEKRCGGGLTFSTCLHLCIGTM